jgi:GTP cyclohydrolase I
MVTQNEAEQAVRTLLAYLEDDPDREGLSKTPKRVIDSWQEIFEGYGLNAAEILDSTFNG